jgi:uncharacterized membrane protein YraQ (UPF0718 family)
LDAGRPRGSFDRGILMEIFLNILRESLLIFKEAAPYILLGFLVAGALRMYMKTEFVSRYFQRGRLRSVFYASLLGIPIPL